ncbi:MAG: hypothetical protein J6T98_10910 [Salinivirgaceae bacterium]|nr:hypothetical protein [Salinivirgaceae bacterium]
MAKHFSLIMAVCLFSTVCAQAAYNGTPVVPKQITKDNYADYQLSEDNYRNYENWYGIRTADELYGFAVLVNEEGKSRAKGVLAANIVVNDNVLNSDGALNGEPRYSWTPIGTSRNKFGGFFDGRGHTISGLYFNDTSNVDYPSGGQNAGLFGFVEGYGSLDKATIKKTGIIDSYFNGCKNVGGIYGHSSRDVIVANCYSTATVKAKNNAGGICGYINTGTDFFNCYNTGKISGNGHVDGICGYIYGIGIVINCYSLKGCAVQSGDVLAGGNAESDFTSGKIAWLLNENSDDPIWYQNLSGQADLGPVLDSTHGVVYASQPCIDQFANTSLGTPSQHNYQDGFCTKCNGYEEPPIVDDWYEIDNAGKLYWFADMVNNHGYTSSKAKLTADIVVNAMVLDKKGKLKSKGGKLRLWTPIGQTGNKFSGYFDGQGHFVSGLYYNNNIDARFPAGGCYVGLFGYVRGGGISNVSVVDTYFNCRYAVGGICGQMYRGTINNCYCDATLITTSRFVGGICGTGNEFGFFKNCLSTARVKGGTYYAGGICGSGDVENCFYLADCAVDGDGVIQGGIGIKTRGESLADKSGKTTPATIDEIRNKISANGLHINKKPGRSKKK